MFQSGVSAVNGVPESGSEFGRPTNETLLGDAAIRYHQGETAALTETRFLLLGTVERSGGSQANPSGLYLYTHKYCGFRLSDDREPLGFGLTCLRRGESHMVKIPIFVSRSIRPVNQNPSLIVADLTVTDLFDEGQKLPKGAERCE